MESRGEPVKKSGLKNIFYYKHEMMAALLALGGILGLVGSYQYYSQILTGYRLLLATIYSTIKLFFFAQTIPIEKEYSVLYEIAKWMAPLGTVIGIFSVFGDMFYHARRSLSSLGRRPYVVVTSRMRGADLLRNILAREKKTSGVLLMTGEEMGKEQSLFLVKKGIKVLPLRFTRDDGYYIREKLKEAGCRKAKSIILFDEDLKNFGNFKVLRKYLPKRREGYDILMKYESEDIKAIIESEIDKMEGVDIRFFNLEEAVAATVLDGMISPGPLLLKKEPLHILIAGFGEMGRAILVQALNIGVIHADYKIQFTIVDREASRRREQLSGLYPRLEEMAEILWIEGEVLSSGVEEAIRQVREEKNVHLTFYTMPEEKTALLSLYRLQGVLGESSVAVFCTDEKNAGELYEGIGTSYSSFRLFGEDAKVLSKAFIIDTDTRKEAMFFNAQYNANAAAIMGEEPIQLSVRCQWDGLSTLKKESSMKQIAHRHTKEKLLSFYLDREGGQSMEARLAQWKEALEGKSISEQVDLILADPLMNRMAAIEHRRWCHFFYLKGYSHGPKKDENRRQHDCLVTDWEVFSVSDKRDTIIYDFIATLNLC